MTCGYATQHVLFHKIHFSLQKESNFYAQLHKSAARICATLGQYGFLVKNSGLLKLVLLTGKGCSWQIITLIISQEHFVFC